MHVQNLFDCDHPHPPPPQGPKTHGRQETLPPKTGRMLPDCRAACSPVYQICQIARPHARQCAHVLVPSMRRVSQCSQIAGPFASQCCQTAGRHRRRLAYKCIHVAAFAALKVLHVCLLKCAGDVTAQQQYIHCVLAGIRALVGSPNEHCRS